MTEGHEGSYRSETNASYPLVFSSFSFLKGVAKANLKKLQDGGHNLEFHLEISINPRFEKEL
jgi:hypothetical protein